MGDIFNNIANVISYAAGKAWTFIIALSIIIVWGVTGPIFHYSDTWQLLINTSTTIITFLMVFLIQNTQNRDAKATQLKLDELIKGVKGASNSFVNSEELSDEELSQLQEHFRTMHNRYTKEITRRRRHGIVKKKKK